MIGKMDLFYAAYISPDTQQTFSSWKGRRGRSAELQVKGLRVLTPWGKAG